MNKVRKIDSINISVQLQTPPKNYELNTTFCEKSQHHFNWSFHNYKNEKSIVCDKLNCKCFLCQNYIGCSPKEQKIMGGTTQNTIFNNQCNPEKDFIFLLHRMKIAMQNVDYFKILISDTITFFKGNPHLLVFNNDDNQNLEMVRSNQQTILFLTSIRNHFIKKIKKPNPFNREKTLTLINISSKYELKTPKIFRSPTLKMTTIMNANPSLNNDIFNKKLIKERGLIRFYDNSVEILVETELKNIFLKQPNDPFWSKIQYIQYFYGNNQNYNEIFRIEYDQEKIDLENDVLFQRSNRVMDIIKGIINKNFENFISAREEFEFQNNLKYSGKDFIKYLTYKIVLLIEKNAKIEIQKLTNEFILVHDCYGQMNFVWINSFGLEYKYKKKLSFTNYFKNGEIGNLLVKKFREKKFTDQNQKEMLQKSKNCKIYLGIMQENYENLKKIILEKKDNDTERKMVYFKRLKSRFDRSRKTKTMIFDKNIDFKTPITKKVETISATIPKNENRHNFLKQKIIEILKQRQQQN